MARTSSIERTNVTDKAWISFRKALEEQYRGRSFGEAGAQLKEILGKAREELESEKLRGEVAGKRLSDIFDHVISTIYHVASAVDEAGHSVAIAATGGYGRSILSPWSDVDLLILYDNIDDEALRRFIDRVLYPLWDAGLVLGQGVHTPGSAVDLAKKDIPTCTAYLDARWLAGEKRVFAKFSDKFESLRRKTGRSFTKAKLFEQADRRQKFSPLRRSLEPDLKEGRGGLRDVHTIEWLYRYNFGEPLNGKRTTGEEFISKSDYKVLLAAKSFLLTTRGQLHLLRGRADERLSFDVQPEIADRLGYTDRANSHPAERLLKHYFHHADNIIRISRYAALQFEKIHAQKKLIKPSDKPASALTTDEVGDDANICIRDKHIDFAVYRSLSEHPLDAFRLHRAHSKRPQTDIHPNALAHVEKAISSLPKLVRDDPEAAALFKGILSKSKSPLTVMRAMSESRLLAFYVPFFSRITGKVDYGLYRRFTLEENVFQALEVLSSLCRSELKASHPMTTEIVTKEKSVLAFYICILLHEFSWSAPQKSSASIEKSVKRVALRLGLDNEVSGHVAWCVARPNELIRVALRRDLDELETIIAFAREAGRVERLDMLLVLTVCHLRVVNEFAWDEWTRVQVSTLHNGAKAFLESGEGGLSAWLNDERELADSLLARAAPKWPENKRRKLLTRLFGDAVASLPSRVLVRAAQLVDAADETGEMTAVDVNVEGALLELIVYTNDRAGLLADISGVIAGEGASVLSVKVMTLDDGRALDVFVIKPFDENDFAARSARLKSLYNKILSAAECPPENQVKPMRRLGDRRKIFDVPPEVMIDHEASNASLVVEARGRDRPGLLYDLTVSLSEIGVQIQSAQIATYGERAVDVFYLQDAPGYKITDKRRIQSIERRLLSVLNDD